MLVVYSTTRLNYISQQKVTNYILVAEVLQFVDFYWLVTFTLILSKTNSRRGVSDKQALIF